MLSVQQSVQQIAGCRALVDARRLAVLACRSSSATHGGRGGVRNGVRKILKCLLKISQIDFLDFLDVFLYFSLAVLTLNCKR